jgi:hypothetical protein
VWATISFPRAYIRNVRSRQKDLSIQLFLHPHKRCPEQSPWLSLLELLILIRVCGVRRAEGQPYKMSFEIPYQ